MKVRLFNILFVFFLFCSTASCAEEIGLIQKKIVLPTHRPEINKDQIRSLAEKLIVQKNNFQNIVEKTHGDKEPKEQVSELGEINRRLLPEYYGVYLYDGKQLIALESRMYTSQYKPKLVPSGKFAIVLFYEGRLYVPNLARFTISPTIRNVISYTDRGTKVVDRSSSFEPPDSDEQRVLDLADYVMVEDKQNKVFWIDPPCETCVFSPGKYALFIPGHFTYEFYDLVVLGSETDRRQCVDLVKERNGSRKYVYCN